EYGDELRAERGAAGFGVGSGLRIVRTRWKVRHTAPVPNVTTAHESRHRREKGIVARHGDDRPDGLVHAAVRKRDQRGHHRLDEVVHREHALYVWFGKQQEWRHVRFQNSDWNFRFKVQTRLRIVVRWS